MQTVHTTSTQVGWLSVGASAWAPTDSNDWPSNSEISRLVAQVYECVSAAEKRWLLEHLLTPLGALARVTVAHGAFAGCLLQSGWRDLQVRLDDAPNVGIDHVIDLVDYVQTVSVESVDALAEMIQAWPGVASSDTAGRLVTQLTQRASYQRTVRNRDGWDL